MLSYPFWSDRHKPQEINLNSVKAPDGVSSILTSGWTMVVGHLGEYCPEVHVGGILDICLQEAGPQTLVVKVRAPVPT